MCINNEGVYLKELFNNIAVRHGEGISGVQLLITKDGKLLQGTVGGHPIEDDQLYTIATIDYLADGNDGMTALPQAEKQECRTEPLCAACSWTMWNVKLLPERRSLRVWKVE